MTTDDDMREIEDAVDTMILHQRKESRDGRGIDLGNRDRLLALIRAKLPAADAEHEAKVEAWEAEATRISIFCGVAVQLVQRMRDDGVRLMRARPAATERDTAAGELLRAAKDAFNWLLECDQNDDAQKLYAAIEAFERAGVKP